MRRWRLLLDTPRGAAENMAVDEALLLSCIEGSGPPTLRIYSWRGPSISLGRLQPLGDGRLDVDFCRREGIEVVRRITGGRAVIHGSDVTFSMALRETDLPDGCSSVLASHHWLMQGIVAGLKSLGIEAALGDRGGAVAAEPNADCFAHIAECDVRVGRGKAVGSAQVRRSGAILEQGSIPYAAPGFDTARVFGRAARSVFEEDLPLAGLTYQAIEQAVQVSFSELLRGELEPGSLSVGELSVMDELARDKYATPEWTVDGRSSDAHELVS